MFGWPPISSPIGRKPGGAGATFQQGADTTHSRLAIRRQPAASKSDLRKPSRQDSGRFQTQRCGTRALPEQFTAAAEHPLVTEAFSARRAADPARLIVTPDSEAGR